MCQYRAIVIIEVIRYCTKNNISHNTREPGPTKISLLQKLYNTQLCLLQLAKISFGFRGRYCNYLLLLPLTVCMWYMQYFLTQGAQADGNHQHASYYTYATVWSESSIIHNKTQHLVRALVLLLQYGRPIIIVAQQSITEEARYRQ